MQNVFTLVLLMILTGCTESAMSQTGKNGLDGLVGATGATGDQGSAGDNGAIGATGAQGNQGAVGPEGLPGALLSIQTLPNNSCQAVVVGGGSAKRKGAKVSVFSDLSCVTRQCALVDGKVCWVNSTQYSSHNDYLYILEF